jgi:hypothetical protein
MTLGLLLLAIPSALASAVLLALSQERNWRIASGPRAGRRAMMRWIGWPAVLLTLALCIARDGASFGPILGLFLLATAFMTVTLILAFRPRWLRPITLPFASDSR